MIAESPKLRIRREIFDRGGAILLEVRELKLPGDGSIEDSVGRSV